jgi:hypothetical protein
MSWGWDGDVDAYRNNLKGNGGERREVMSTRWMFLGRGLGV